MAVYTKVLVDDRGAVKYLKDVLGRFSSKQKVFEGPVLDILTDYFEKQFDSEGSHGGTPWEPLTPATLRIKAAKGFGHMPILRRTDALYDALTQRGIGVTGRSLKIDNDTFVFRVHLTHAARHQEGTPKMVARPLLPERGMPNEFLDALQNRFVGYLLRGELKKAPRGK